ncbi:somatostatin-2-like [Callorhinchus milii]|uniref:somatostatin-2-like n=1 Tax=Callorhinchus milii TaxID=7868 RepID=UPI00045717D9|nr:somatostatin-2-like [Callorhinchus milii]|eukprot:gi/632960048/ref/XP_007895974.1/ PREDICTED: somatostatin-2-like [Callorhinchus milii]
MQILVALISTLFLVSGVSTTTASLDDRFNLQSSREMNQERKEMILKLLSGLLDNAAVSGQTGSEAGYPEPADGGPVMLEERSRYSQLPQRSRKVPCKNFFWKTFTSC